MNSAPALAIPSLPNLRDLGGYPALNGHVVRRGLVYRSDQPNPVTPEDLVLFAALGIKTVFDLRTDEEAALRPDVLPPGVKRVALNVFGDVGGSRPVILGELLRRPKEANALLGGGKVEALLERAYRAFITLPSARAAYRQLFESLGDRDRLPALFHCLTGKDRTGWAAAALLTLLGVSKDDVLEDYLRSNDCVLPHYRQAIDAFAAAGGEESIALAVFGVKPESLEASFDEMEKQHGTIERYFSDSLGIDATGQDAIRNVCLEATRRRSRSGRSA